MDQQHTGAPFTQDQLLAAKYGGLKPKPRLIMKEKKCFDSADWALAKEGKKQQPGAIQMEPAHVPVPDVHHNTKHGGSHLKPGA